MSLAHLKSSYHEIVCDEQIQRDLLKIDPNLIKQLTSLNNSTPQLFIYLASFNGHVLGLLSLSINPNTHTKTIHHLIVRESTRRRGVGLFLLAESITAIQSENKEYPPHPWIIVLSTEFIEPELTEAELTDNSIAPTSTLIADLKATYESMISPLRKTYPELSKLDISVISQ